MSHFTVTVCLDGDGMPDLRRALVVARGLNADAAAGLLRGAVDNRLDAILTPYSESLETEPYRDYEDGSPGDHWLFSSLKRGAESWQRLQETGAEALANERVGKHYDGTLAGRDLEMSVEAVNKAAGDWEKDAAVLASIPGPVTWETIIRMYAERFPGEDSEKLFTDGERAWTMSTYNPESKWDWFQVGGRWGGRFPFRKGHDRQVLRTERHWTDGPGDVIMPGHCDGGPLSALDLARMRDEAAADARKTYVKYQETVRGTPDALPWSVFADNISEGNGYTIDQAREEYHSQPRIKAIEGTDFMWMDDPIGEFSVPEDLYAERARASAVPGWATVTTDGRWMEKGKMGWWALNDATTDSTIGYLEAANAYIEALPADAWLVSVDCHI